MLWKGKEILKSLNNNGKINLEMSSSKFGFFEACGRSQRGQAEAELRLCPAPFSRAPTSTCFLSQSDEGSFGFERKPAPRASACVSLGEVFERFYGDQSQ